MILEPNIYNSSDGFGPCVLSFGRELTRDRIRVRKLYRKYNLSAPATMSMDPSDEGDDDSDDLMGVQRRELLAQIFGLDDEQKHRIEIEPPFYLYVPIHTGAIRA